MKKAHLHLIKWAVARGYSIAVYGEGEFDGIHSTYKDIKDNCEACDMGQLVLVKPVDGAWISVATFVYVFEYDQEPDEIIADYGVNSISEQWDRDYEETKGVTA